MEQIDLHLIIELSKMHYLKLKMTIQCVIK